MFDASLTDYPSYHMLYHHGPPSFQSSCSFPDSLNRHLRDDPVAVLTTDRLSNDIEQEGQKKLQGQYSPGSVSQMQEVAGVGGTQGCEGERELQFCV